jgi:hypothetical protein
LHVALGPVLGVAVAIPGLAWPAHTAARLTADQAWTKLYERVEACEKSYNYDPETIAVDERSLAPNEKRFRQCVYESIEKLMIPNSLVPDAYRTLIKNDQRWTESIETGEMTRTERREQLDAGIAQLKVEEAVQQDALVVRMDALNEEMVRMRAQHERLRALQHIPSMNHSRAMGGLRR